MRSLCCVIVASDVSNYSPIEIFMRLILTTIILTMLAQPVWAKKVTKKKVPLNVLLRPALDRNSQLLALCQHPHMGHH